MAAAEARTAWQRTANRMFVQEDAKRAPKLPCCPTSCTSSKQVDVGPTGVLDGSAHPVIGFASVSGIPSASNSHPETRWWLQLQPNFGYQRSVTCEQLNVLDADGEDTKSTYILGPSPKFIGGFPRKIEDSKFIDATVYAEKDPVVTMPELKTIKHNENAPDKMNESYQVVDSAFQKSDELCFDSESVWFASEKTEPWWHTTDKDELASFVAQKSHDHVENCDLPPPQKMHVRKDQFSQFGNFDRDIAVSSLRRRSISDLNSFVQSSSTLESSHGRQQAKVDMQPLYASKSSLSSPHEDMTMPHQISEKAQLLKALCYSQTRAREAENEAKKAKAENEHLVELLLRQASQLFAYKQWLQILQLEALYLHLKNNGQPILNVFPLAFPRMASKARKSQDSLHKASSRKPVNQGGPKFDIGKCAVALALGFSLVGAGLLLGWTVGWMFPTF